MLVIDSRTDHLHDPPYEFTPQGLTPYSECPARAESIRQAMASEPTVTVMPPDPLTAGMLSTVHEREYLHYLEHIHRIWCDAERGSSVVIPDTFAIRAHSHKPSEILRQTGYYCFDAQTPIVAGTYRAALDAAACAITGTHLGVFQMSKRHLGSQW